MPHWINFPCFVILNGVNIKIILLQTQEGTPSSLLNGLQHSYKEVIGRTMQNTHFGNMTNTVPLQAFVGYEIVSHI